MQVLCIVNFKFLKMKNTLLLLTLVLSFNLTAQIKVGDAFPEIVLKDIHNQEVTVSSTGSHFILIDFWASWCAPCRFANKELVKLNSEYADSNIMIVGISLDIEKKKWLKAVEKDKINYLQLNDPNGFDAVIALRFGVEQLPPSYLFNPSGKLIAVNPTSQQISNYLNLK